MINAKKKLVKVADSFIFTHFPQKPFARLHRRNKGRFHGFLLLHFPSSISKGLPLAVFDLQHKENIFYISSKFKSTTTHFCPSDPSHVCIRGAVVFSAGLAMHC